MCAYLLIRRLKWRIGVNDFPTERLLSDYQATFPLRCGNFISSPTVAPVGMPSVLRYQWSMIFCPLPASVPIILAGLLTGPGLDFLATVELTSKAPNTVTVAAQHPCLGWTCEVHTTSYLGSPHALQRRSWSWSLSRWPRSRQRMTLHLVAVLRAPPAHL